MTNSKEPTTTPEEVAVVAVLGTERVDFEAYVRDPCGIGNVVCDDITPDGTRWRWLGTGTLPPQDGVDTRAAERERARRAILAAFPEAAAGTVRATARLSIPLPDAQRTASRVALWAALPDAQLAPVCEAIAAHLDEAPHANLLRAVRAAGDAAHETLTRYATPRFVRVP